MFDEKKPPKWIWITIASIITVAAIALFVFFAFFRNAGPLLSLSRAIDNLNTEVEERINSTALKSIIMLPEILEDGAVKVSFDYSTPIFGEWLTANIDGEVRLLSNTEERKYALGAEVNVYGQTLDFEANMNRERLAARLSLLGDDYFGITYDTFRKDINSFGNLIGLSSSDMDMLADIVDQINDLMNADEDSDDLLEPYTEAFVEFFKNLDVSSGRARIELDEENIRCTEIKVKITKDAVIKLLEDIYDILKYDETMRSQFEVYNSPLLQGITGSDNSNYDRFLSEYRSFLRDFERNYSGDIEILFYVGQDDRLLRVEIVADIEYDGDDSEYTVVFDFGTSLEDDWVFTYSTINRGSTDIFEIKWTYEEQSGRYTQRIEISENDKEIFSLLSTWNESRGDFSLAYNMGTSGNSIKGIFTATEEDFQITLDDLFPATSNNSLLIGISAETGVQINEIDFINIDKWGNALIEAVTRLIIGGLLF